MPLQTSFWANLFMPDCGTKRQSGPVWGKDRRGRGENEEDRLLLVTAVCCPLISGHHSSNVMNHYLLIGLSALLVL